MTKSLEKRLVEADQLFDEMYGNPLNKRMKPGKAKARLYVEIAHALTRHDSGLGFLATNSAVQAALQTAYAELK
jgi:hypothetical protein